jgi:F-type H+-transporting ATPase subunit b
MIFGDSDESPKHPLQFIFLFRDSSFQFFIPIMTVSAFILASAEVVTEAADQGPIEKIVDKFGLHWSLFISQLVAFLIVCFLLKKFAYGPVMEMLEQRKQRIEDGETKLTEIEKQLEESEAQKAALLEKANADAKRMITEAKESATVLGEQRAQEAVAQAQTILNKAQEAARAERAAMAAELKQEFGRLVVATTSQVAGKELSAADQKRINEEAVASLS